MQAAEAPFRLFAGDFARDRVAVVAAAVLCLILSVAIFAPLVSPQDPYNLAQLDILDSKLAPGANENPCEVTHVYGREEAFDVIRRAQADYHEKFGSLESLLDAALKA